jgi:3''-phosphoadenosine 5''-phosphosulfate sulfotransferase (PAPS reductase)/FAD synthetase and related enzymes
LIDFIECLPLGLQLMQMIEHRFWKAKLEGTSPEEGLNLLSGVFGSSAKFSTSLGLEDQVITHMIASAHLSISIFSIDTGRLFQETHDLLELTRDHYRQPVQVYYPNHQQIEKLVSEKGPNSFYHSVGNRKECCHIRKVEPLKRALADAKIWITGIRAEQSPNRQMMDAVEWDEQHQVIKYHPYFIGHKSK